MFDIKEQLKKLPDKPGVYIMKNKYGEIIYIGKAISLKNRVRQYFQSSKNHTPKINAMVSNIEEFEYIITDSEVEALILESNLIKKNQPKYNVLLRDDKSYPYIKVTLKDKYPRVLKTRTIKNDGSKYFGPYTDVGAVNQIIDLINRYYPLKKCGQTRFSSNHKPCLNYHINQCLGVCSNEVDKNNYDKMIKDILLFLNGKNDMLINGIKEKMSKASLNMDYESAAEYRDQINAINSIKEKQKIVLSSQIDIDVIAMARNIEDDVCVMIFFVRKGQLIGRENYIVHALKEDSNKEIISSFIKQFYSGTAIIPKEIVLIEEIEEKEIIEKWLTEKRKSKVMLVNPKKGEKKALLDMAIKNAIEISEQFNNKFKKDKEQSEGAINSLKNYLQLDKVPSRIEAYDVSNIQGAYSVASMVVFERGRPKYSDYRRFKIKTIEGPNDYGSLQEVIYRRFKKVINGDKKLDEKNTFSILPDLLLIDGGFNHVNAVKSVLDALKINITIAGMVKDNNHKTYDLIYKGNNINIRCNKEVYNFISRVQDEAHRFAISYHKSLRGKSLTKSVLDEINGIGDRRKIELLKHFGTIEEIKKASIDELSKVKSMNKKASEEIKRFFKEIDKKK